jgi:hypothetical protein
MTFQLLIWPSKGATSAAPGSAVCRTVAEIAIDPLGRALASGLPRVTVAACVAEAPKRETEPATPTTATHSLLDKRNTEAPTA